MWAERAVWADKCGEGGVSGKGGERRCGKTGICGIVEGRKYRI